MQKAYLTITSGQYFEPWDTNHNITGCKVYDGATCNVIKYNSSTDTYILQCPIHSNESFYAASKYVTLVDGTSPEKTVPPQTPKPLVCICTMPQLWKTGCVCGHITRFVSKKV
jgi:hypothetical protein